MQEISIQTQEESQVIDITDRINDLVAESGVTDGRCHLFILHTTAALTTADLDPGTDQDMLDAFYEMIPDLDYRHPHDPEHVPDHILSTLIGSSLVIPVEGQSLTLGTWQRAVLFEFDGPRDRQLRISIISESQ